SNPKSLVVLGQQVCDEHVPDVCLIGEMGDVTELGRLLQLVLGCAVSCDQKQGITSPGAHSADHDAGGISAACCDGGYPRGAKHTCITH
uniref:HOOK N-terminal domain-containing protein n=1 Tax=Cyprinus carpio TaxID=7962 RepID=A0A8C2JXA3_CYPCA